MSQAGQPQSPGLAIDDTPGFYPPEVPVYWTDPRTGFTDRDVLSFQRYMHDHFWHALPNDYRRITVKSAASTLMSDLVDLHTHYLQSAAARVEGLVQADPALAAALTDIFGDSAAIASWLVTPQKAFGGALPAQLLGEGRRDEVVDLLGRIAHGVLS